MERAVPGSAAGEGQRRALVAADAPGGDSAQGSQIERLRRYLFFLAAAWLGLAGVAAAQLRGVKADVSPIVEADGARVGSETRLALQVTLPDGYHVQSDKPRDPNLIPTVLTVEVPQGVT